MLFFRIFPLLLFVALQHLAAAPVGTSAGAGLPHPLHVTMTEIRHNVQQQSLEISIHLFTDDLGAALKASGAPELFLGESREHLQSDDYIQRYLNKHFSISINGKAMHYTFIGKEKKDDAIWCHVEIVGVKTVKSITIQSSLLTDVYSDEQGIVHITANGSRKSLILFQGNEQETLSW
jgi:hypothetical protein